MRCSACSTENPPQAKFCLECAAPLARRCSSCGTVLPAAAELQAGLSRLQSAELLYAVSLFPAPEYTFKHGLTHEVAYGSLLQERRRALHGRILDAIERLYADRVDEQVERLGRHAVGGQVWEKAVVYLRQAALKAASRPRRLPGAPSP